MAARRSAHETRAPDFRHRRGVRHPGDCAAVFRRGQIAQNDPPAITHPEFFYGFIGVTLAWQLVFLVIARNPVRYRPLMLVSVLEKLAYGIPAIALFMQQRIKTMTLAFGCIDLVLGALFVLAFFFTPRSEASAAIRLKGAHTLASPWQTAAPCMHCSSRSQAPSSSTRR